MDFSFFGFLMLGLFFTVVIPLSLIRWIVKSAVMEALREFEDLKDN